MYIMSSYPHVNHQGSSSQPTSNMPVNVTFRVSRANSSQTYIAERADYTRESILRSVQPFVDAGFEIHDVYSTLLGLITVNETLCPIERIIDTFLRSSKEHFNNITFTHRAPASKDQPDTDDEWEEVETDEKDHRIKFNRTLMRCEPDMGVPSRLTRGRDKLLEEISAMYSQTDSPSAYLPTPARDEWVKKIRNIAAMINEVPTEGTQHNIVDSGINQATNCSADNTSSPSIPPLEHDPDVRVVAPDMHLHLDKSSNLPKGYNWTERDTRYLQYVYANYTKYPSNSSNIEYYARMLSVSVTQLKAVLSCTEYEAVHRMLRHWAIHENDHSWFVTDRKLTDEFLACMRRN